MFEGKEVEGKIGDVGGYYLDVEATGKVTVALEVKKEFEGGAASSSNKVEVELMTILEKTAEKTGATWDDKAVATIKGILKLAV